MVGPIFQTESLRYLSVMKGFYWLLSKKCEMANGYKELIDGESRPQMTSAIGCKGLTHDAG